MGELYKTFLKNQSCCNVMCTYIYIRRRLILLYFTLVITYTGTTVFRDACTCVYPAVSINYIEKL